MTDHEAWLALTKENIIEPDLPICDAHHHLWDWPGRCYLLKELFQDIGRSHNIVRTVFVESESARSQGTIQGLQPVAETKFTHEITSRDASRQYGKTVVAAGIIGFADLRLGAEVAPVLKAHLAASDRFRGVRQLCSWDADSKIRSMSAPGILKDSTFREGIACLRKHKLSFETFIYFHQLNEFIDLARAFPDITMIINHIGGPLGVGPYASKRSEVFREWKSKITELAECPNVFVKLGGLGMPECGFGWNDLAVPPNSTELVEGMAPYLLWCIEQFGAHRCMFESNFPVDRASYSYAVLWNAFKRISKGFSKTERAALFNGTAQKAYRL